MPTYQYACTEADCGHSFEQVQAFSDDALTVCPQCEGRLRKVFNAVGVVFKGSGFYRTDSRPRDTSKDGDKSSSTASSGDKSGSTAAPAEKSGGSASGTTSTSTSSTSPGGSSTTSSAGAA